MGFGALGAGGLGRSADRQFPRPRLNRPQATDHMQWPGTLGVGL